MIKDGVDASDIITHRWVPLLLLSYFECEISVNWETFSTIVYRFSVQCILVTKIVLSLLNNFYWEVSLKSKESVLYFLTIWRDLHLFVPFVSKGENSNAQKKMTSWLTQFYWVVLWIWNRTTWLLVIWKILHQLICSFICQSEYSSSFVPNVNVCPYILLVRYCGLKFSPAITN
jgi:hypothetical protein